MNLLIPLMLILIAEYVADFLLQDRKMALKKSTDDLYLLAHGFTIFACIAAIGAGFGASMVYLAAAYAVLHMLQDKFIWNVYKAQVLSTFGFVDKKKETLERWMKEKKYADDKFFYDIIGLDRLLHVLTLIGLYAIFFL